MRSEALAHLSQTDPVLGELIKKVGPCTLTPRDRRSPFQALVQAVVFQQLNGNVAEKILKRVRGLYPTSLRAWQRRKIRFVYLPGNIQIICTFGCRQAPRKMRMVSVSGTG